jgi:BirA family biotin operon repressor/biotin-[acetyl-CoA-carboxylase] ligase
MSPVSAAILVSGPAKGMLPKGLLERMADGRPRSRRALANSLDLGIDELERELERLKALGLEILEGDGGELRLAEPIDWIDVASVEASLDPGLRPHIDRIERFFDLESTNRHLLGQPAPDAGRMRVAIAEYQHAGRGRRGRRWTMSPGAGVALSASWRFDRVPSRLTALSLAVGAAARRAIHDVAGLDVGLKWPNDLVVDGGKLGGILVEHAQIAGGRAHVVAGIGINVHVPETLLSVVSDWPGGARDLARATSVAIDRSLLAGALIERLVELFLEFATTGFEPYRAEWLAAHLLNGATVELRTDRGTDVVTVLGIESDGALIVENCTGETQRILSGDVTLRGGV